MFDSLDKAIIAAMQQDLPLTPEPYREIADSLGISQELLLAKLQSFHETGKIRKLGAVLRHRKVGFNANALCAWVVPPDRLDEVGAKMAAEPFITHCYARAAYPGWPYTLYTMLHSYSRMACDAIARGLASKVGIENYVLMYSTKEWKKTSMRYFNESGANARIVREKDA